MSFIKKTILNYDIISVKLGKSGGDAANYIGILIIALLIVYPTNYSRKSFLYKWYKRAMPVINTILLIEQARFRPNRISYDQVLALTG